MNNNESHLNPPNGKAKKGDEDQEVLNKYLFTSLLCDKDKNGRLHFNLVRLTVFFTVCILSWWFCIYSYIETKGYASQSVRHIGFILAFLGSFIPILSFLIGFSEKLEVWATKQLVSFGCGDCDPSSFVVWAVKGLQSVVQSGSVCLVLLACSFVSSLDIETWVYLTVFVVICASILLYQANRKTDRDLIIDEKRCSTASIHTSSSFNMRVDTLGIKEYFELVKNSCYAIERLSPKTKQVTLKSHLVSKTLQARFKRELRDSTEWKVERDLIKSSVFYSFWGVALSSLGYGKGLELEPTNKMVIRRLTDAEKSKKIAALKQKKPKNPATTQNIDIKENKPKTPK
jgi:hypothetical protein